jgi:hypothetical protein
MVANMVKEGCNTLPEIIIKANLGMIENMVKVL